MREQLKVRVEENEAQRVTVDPMVLADERERAAQQLASKEQTLQMKKQTLQEVSQRNQLLNRLIQERKAHLEFIKSAQQLKEKKKREKEHILEGKRQLD